MSMSPLDEQIIECMHKILARGSKFVQGANTSECLLKLAAQFRDEADDVQRYFKECERDGRHKELHQAKLLHDAILNYSLRIN